MLNKLQCNHCNRGFRDQTALQQHQKVKHPATPKCNNRSTNSSVQRVKPKKVVHRYACDRCKKEFKSPSALKDHDEDKHPSVKHIEFAETYRQHKLEVAAHPTHKCPDCDTTFYSAEAFTQHKWDNHPSFKCNYCDRIFKSADTYRQHTFTAHSCSECGAGFYSSSVLEQHICDKHPTAFGRNYCNRVFRFADARRQHESAVHPHRCTEFDTAFSSLDAPKQHEYDKHPVDSQDVSVSTLERVVELEGVSVTTDDLLDKNNNKDVLPTHYCPSCRGVFDTDDNFRRHTCQPHGSKIPPHCGDCFSRFADDASLQQHLVSRAPFSCKICGAQLCSENTLQEHQEWHPTCEKCGKLFGDESALYRHVEYEHRIVVCWDCGGAVISQDNLSLHYAFQHPSCLVCGLRMEEPGMLNDHMVSEHAGEQVQEPRQSPEPEESQYGHQKLVWSSPFELIQHEEKYDDTLSASLASPPSFTPRSNRSALDETVDETAIQYDPHWKGNIAELCQISSPGPLTPSVNGSDTGEFDSDSPLAEETSANGSPQPPASPASSLVLEESYDGISDPSSVTSSSQSAVYVTADSTPDHVTENRAHLVVTRATSRRSSGTTSPSRLSSPVFPLDSLGFPPEFSAVPDTSAHITGHNGSTRHELRLHCRICNRDPCENMTATICGHIFCRSCITKAVVGNSECPVCKSATLLYCLFHIDLTA